MNLTCQGPGISFNVNPFPPRYDPRLLPIGLVVSSRPPIYPYQRLPQAYTYVDRQSTRQLINNPAPTVNPNTGLIARQSRPPSDNPFTTQGLTPPNRKLKKFKSITPIPGGGKSDEMNSRHRSKMPTSHNSGKYLVNRINPSDEYRSPHTGYNVRRTTLPARTRSPKAPVILLSRVGARHSTNESIYNSVQTAQADTGRVGPNLPPPSGNPSSTQELTPANPKSGMSASILPTLDLGKPDEMNSQLIKHPDFPEQPESPNSDNYIIDGVEVSFRYLPFDNDYPGRTILPYPSRENVEWTEFPEASFTPLTAPGGRPRKPLKDIGDNDVIYDQFSDPPGPFTFTATNTQKRKPKEDTHSGGVTHEKQSGRFHPKNSQNRLNSLTPTFSKYRNLDFDEESDSDLEGVILP
jgi:hypothetical protein